jgi:hypothetical protein
MKQETSRAFARKIMIEFAELTGLLPSGNAPRRYLWTDAFAVCNFLELYRQTGDEQFRHLALRLVDQGHHILGRHRADDSRIGWISGLDEEEGGKHPTKGGLRIGKGMNERRPGEAFDEQLEWDRDGQYYHYLTKWMRALDRVSRVSGDSTYNTWAMELAKTAHARFAYAPSSGRQKRMYWKMSIDLARPLVASMGHHDPLDGFVTYNQLQAGAARESGGSASPDLSAEIADMAKICEGKSWATDDPLGMGGLLSDAYRVAQLVVEGALERTDLLQDMLDSSLVGLESYARTNPCRLPADYRLAFRELGLSIGLSAVEKLKGLIEMPSGPFAKNHALGLRLDRLTRYAPIRESVETFWLDRTNREAASWLDHRDINMVMLATSLAPDGYLTL